MEALAESLDNGFAGIIIIDNRIIYELPPLDSVLSQMDKVLESVCQTPLRL